MELIKHIGNKMPVKGQQMVVYRTTNEHVQVSHIHMPARAIDLIWDDKPQIGRIHSYRVVG